MNSLVVVEREAIASRVMVSDDELTIHLVDGRKISAPIVWYPRLSNGTKVERAKYELIGRGTGIHWPLLDEDLSVAGIMNGNPSFESEDSLRIWLAQRKSNQMPD